MNKVVTNVFFPEREEEIEIVLYKFSKFLFNDGNNLFFESGYIDNNEEDKFVKHKFIIIKYHDGISAPNLAEFVCSYVDNAHIRYLVFEDVSNNPLVQFGKMFGGFNL